jgi:acetyl esterase/lipase
MVGMSAVLASCFWVSLGNRIAADTPKGETGRTPASEISDGIIHQPDLTYHSIEGKPLMLDMVFPQSGPGPFPAVILLHGSGPANKGRKGMVFLANEMARKGYVGVAVSYRCRPEESFPAPLLDVQCAIRWVRAHADQYKLDKNQIAVIGFSGGGTLACLLGTMGCKDSLVVDSKELTQSSPLRAIVSFYGPTDLARIHEVCQKKSKEGSYLEKLQSDYIMKSLEKWLGGPPSKVQEHYDGASPMSKDFQECSPVLLIHGSEDSVVPVDQSRLFAKKLQKCGRPVNLLVIEGAGHDFEEKSKTDGRLAFAAVRAFLDEHLLSASKAMPLVKKDSGDQYEQEMIPRNRHPRCSARFRN